MTRYRVEGRGRGLQVLEFPVLSTTMCGVWIDIGAGEKRFVMNDGRKCFARATKEDALKDFVARKRRHIAILRAQLDTVEMQKMRAETRGEELIAVGHVADLDW